MYFWWNIKKCRSIVGSGRSFCIVGVFCYSVRCMNVKNYSVLSSDSYKNCPFVTSLLRIQVVFYFIYNGHIFDDITVFYYNIFLWQFQVREWEAEQRHGQGVHQLWQEDSGNYSWKSLYRGRCQVKHLLSLRDGSKDSHSIRLASKCVIFEPKPFDSNSNWPPFERI